VGWHEEEGRTQDALVGNAVTDYPIDGPPEGLGVRFFLDLAAIQGRNIEGLSSFVKALLMDHDEGIKYLRSINARFYAKTRK
jgi:hypothetical protein